MARHAADQRGSRWLRSVFIGLAAICGLGAAAVIIPPMMFEPSADVTLIKAEKGPFKVKPKDPGGVDIPHQETTVMSMIGGLVEQQEDVEILQPPSAVPEMPPTPMDQPSAQAALEPVAPTGPAVTEAPVNVDTPAAEAGVVQAEDNGTTSDEDTGTDMAAGENPAIDTETTDLAIAKPTAKPKPPKRVRVEGDDPLYLVQLAAFREMATAREQAGLLNSKHKARLDGAELGTMKSDSGGDGIFWRVVTEPLARAEADRICASLKRAGQDCILRKFDAAAG